MLVRGIARHELNEYQDSEPGHRGKNCIPIDRESFCTDLPQNPCGKENASAELQYKNCPSFYCAERKRRKNKDRSQTVQFNVVGANSDWLRRSGGLLNIRQRQGCAQRASFCAKLSSISRRTSRNPSIHNLPRIGLPDGTLAM